MKYPSWLSVGVLLWLAAQAFAAAPSNGTVFARSVQVPNLGAGHVLPEPRDILDPLTASRQSHWRFRYLDGRLCEVARRDAEGSFAPMRVPYEGMPTNGFLFAYAPGAAQPVALTTPRGVRYDMTYDGAGMLVALQRAPRLAPLEDEPTRITIDRAQGRVQRVRYWHGAVPARDADGIHQRAFFYGEDGYLTRVEYRDAQGRVCPSAQGCAIKTYRRGPRGEWREICLYDARGVPCADWHGVARYAFEYTSNGLLRVMRLFDARNAPATNTFGAHALEWQYDDALQVIGTRASDATNTVVYDGPALMPEIFERTWAEAVLMREKNELALPIWSFIDYNELTRSLRRYIQRVASDRPTLFAVEQLRVLAEYIMAARAGNLAVMCAQLCAAAGLDDARWLQVACLHAGVAPRPDSAAARYVSTACLGGDATNALAFICSDPLYYVLLYATTRHARGTAPAIVHAHMLADSIYINTLRALYGTNLWLPTLRDVRRAAEEYARSDDARRALEDDAVLVDMTADQVRIAGQPAVTRINAALMRRMSRHTARRALYEDYTPLASVARALWPAGPLFSLAFDAAPAPTPAQADDMLNAWTQRVAILQAQPRSHSWRAARHVLSELAGAQAAYLDGADYPRHATRLFALAQAMAPAASYAALRQARLLMQAGQYAAATSVLTRCQLHARANATVAALLTACSAACAQADRIAVLRGIISAGAPRLTNVMELAGLYQRAGQISNALITARTNIDLSTADNAVCEWYATLLARCGDWDGADRALARLTEQNPGNFNYWTSRAALAFSRGTASNGIAHLHRAAALDQQRLARILTAHGFLDELRGRGQTNLVENLETLFVPDDVQHE
ncbi:MAG: hypothetical protein NTV22_06790 [bacterium]|nr:hypothetical protein [bacterium]